MRGRKEEIGVQTHIRIFDAGIKEKLDKVMELSKYKFNDGEWKASGNKYPLQSTAEDGSYSFYAQDNYGDKTDVKTIRVGADLYGEFVKSDKDNSVYFTWDRSNWTATVIHKNLAIGTTRWQTTSSTCLSSTVRI